MFGCLSTSVRCTAVDPEACSRLRDSSAIVYSGNQFFLVSHSVILNTRMCGQMKALRRGVETAVETLTGPKANI